MFLIVIRNKRGLAAGKCQSSLFLQYRKLCFLYCKDLREDVLWGKLNSLKAECEFEPLVCMNQIFRMSR